MGSLVARALDLAFPALCAGCGTEGRALCPTCSVTLEVRIDQPPGVPIGLAGDVPAPLLQVDWCAPFAGTVRKALHALKYRGERRLAEPLGVAVARRWGRVAAGGEVLVPVPVHADRRRERGYDQAELIAVAAAEAIGLPVIPALERRRATDAQYALDRAHRADNVRDAFQVRSSAREAVSGRWVVLVDDVFTTGATLSACATALLTGGAAAVSAVAVARER